MFAMPRCKRFISGVLPACAAFVVVLMAGCQRNISGSYLASDNSAVVWLQVVRTPRQPSDRSDCNKRPKAGRHSRTKLGVNHRGS